MPAFIDITGLRFGRLVVIQFSHMDKYHRSMWICLCDCGTQRVFAANPLRQGKSHSCGCLQREIVGNLRRTHGRGRTRLYKRWTTMIQRCTNPNNAEWKNYGGRGIKVGERWLHSFENYLAHWGEIPDGMYVDRIDNDGDYTPENCRLVTPLESSQNMRRRGRLPKKKPS